MENTMNIWVDGDACPKAIKDIVCRVAQRTKITTIFVANQWLRLPESEFLSFIRVDQGADVADDEIVDKCNAGDLVITADIPLAARIVAKEALALDPRGKMYNANNIGQILSMRDFMDELRGSGVETGGPKSFGQREAQKFANALDKLIAQR